MVVDSTDLNVILLCACKFTLLPAVTEVSPLLVTNMFAFVVITISAPAVIVDFPVSDFMDTALFAVIPTFFPDAAIPA